MTITSLHSSWLEIVWLEEQRQSLEVVLGLPFGTSAAEGETNGCLVENSPILSSAHQDHGNESYLEPSIG